MTTSLDLRQLAIDRGTASPGKAPRRGLFSRYVLPGLLIFGFLAMLGWAARDTFVTAKPVTVVPVIVTRAAVQATGTPLFQAAGWIEPRPTPVLVTALAEGVVEELLVVEGQEVRAEEPVARLINTDAQLALEQAQADLALRQAEVENARAELRAARLRFETPLHLQVSFAEAESQLAKTETEQTRLPFLIQAAEARVEYARQNLKGKQAASSALSERTIQQAESEHAGALSELKELKSRESRLAREVETLQQKRDVLARQLELRIDETRQVAAAEAQLKAAEARVQQAELAVRVARLRLERMVVKAPVTGRVLSLVAQPGSRVMGLDPGGEHRASTVVTLYDPQMLQVRADVRLEDVPRVLPGQPVKIETVSSSEPLEGEVLYATSQANIQKNTLEVKIAVKSPPATIRPEMLVTATFLAPELPESKSESSEELERLLVPRELVQGGDEGQIVWIADADGRARRRSIRLGTAGTSELVEVTEGLTPTDRLISSGNENLGDGDRITIVGEDHHLGLSASFSSR